MLTVWATLFCTVLTVQATVLLLAMLATPFFMVLLVRATMLLAFSRVLTVWATLFSMVLTVQATVFLAFSRVLNCLSHPIFYGAYCSSHHVISLSQVLTVWATLFCTGANCSSQPVVTCYVSHPPFLWCSLLEPLSYSFPQGRSMFGALQYYLFRCRYIINK